MTFVGKKFAKKYFSGDSKLLNQMWRQTHIKSRRRVMSTTACLACCAMETMKWDVYGREKNIYYRTGLTRAPKAAVLRIRIRDPVPFWPLDRGSGLGFFRIPDLGSRIPSPYFWELGDNFLGKKFYNSLKIGPNFFLQHFKNKIVQFCEMDDSKKRYDNSFFFTNVFHCCFWIRDPRSEIRDPGWVKIWIRDRG